MLLASRHFLQVIEKHEHDPGNLLPTEEVHNFGHLFNNGEGVVFEMLMGEIMRTQNPKESHHIISNLRALNAGAFEEVGNDLEAVKSAELSGELVCLQKSE